MDSRICRRGAERRRRTALRNAVLSEEFRKACDRVHAPVLYQDANDYRKYVLAEHAHQKRLIEKLKLRERLRHP